MNYRQLLSEMYIDYMERKSRETNPDKKEVYHEITTDIKIALDLEVGMIDISNKAKDIINPKNP